MKLSPNLGPIKILTIDDSRPIRLMVRSAFEEYDVEVEEAVDGLDAVKVVKKFKPDIILLDVEMPKVNGVTFLRALRQNRFFKETPVIMLTAERKRTLVEEIMSLGIHSYIIKPFKPEQLVEKVANSIQLKKKNVDIKMYYEDSAENA